MKFFLLFLMINSFAFAEEKMDAKSKAHMEALMKAATPGEEHALLKKMEGSWNTVTRVWMKPGETPSEDKGTSENKIVLEGRFLHQDFTSTHMGRPFSGMGALGYDNVKKAFVSTWMDNMTTGIMISYGTANKDGSVITMTGDWDDPMSKKKMKMKMVTKLESDTKHVFEMWHKDPKGKEYMSMEIVYTKK